MLSVAHLVERVSCIKAESLLQRPGFDSSRTAMVCCMFSPPSLCPAVTLNKAEMAKKKKKQSRNKMFSSSVQLLLFTVQATHLILITVNISDKRSLPRQWYRVQFFQFVFHFQTSRRNMTQGYLGGSEENPFIIPGVCGVGEINRGVHAGFIYILLCEPYTLTWGKEDEWVVGGEEVREFQKQGGALEGKRKLEMERWKSYLYTKFLVHSHRPEWLRLKQLWGS